MDEIGRESKRGRRGERRRKNEVRRQGRGVIKKGGKVGEEPRKEG